MSVLLSAKDVYKTCKDKVQKGGISVLNGVSCDFEEKGLG